MIINPGNRPSRAKVYWLAFDAILWVYCGLQSTLRSGGIKKPAPTVMARAGRAGHAGD